MGSTTKTIAGSQGCTTCCPDNENNNTRTDEARSIDIAAKGVSTGNQFAKLMSALMSDLIEGKITPSVANAAVNAGGKLLKITEMQLRFGTSNKSRPREIQLIGSE